MIYVFSLGRVVCGTAVTACLVVVPAFAQSSSTSGQTQTPPPTQTPVPKPAPFPGANPPSPNKPAGPTTPATQPAPATSGVQQGGPIDPRLAGIPIYPGADLLESFDGGGNQQVFLFGSTMPYSDVLAFYKTQLRSGGNEIFRTPAMQQFDLGSFRAETMAYRPSVVLKDYGGSGAAYLHVTGTTEKRYQTVIQIVPVVK